MANVERVPVTRLITIGGYVTPFELDQIIDGLSEDIHDEWRESGPYGQERGKVKIKIEFIED